MSECRNCGERFIDHNIADFSKCEWELEMEDWRTYRKEKWERYEGKNG